MEYSHETPHFTTVFKHYNPVGPGQYDLPSMFGKETAKSGLNYNSNIASKPSFSFG